LLSASHYKALFFNETWQWVPNPKVYGDLALLEIQRYNEKIYSALCINIPVK